MLPSKVAPIQAHIEASRDVGGMKSHGESTGPVLMGGVNGVMKSRVIFVLGGEVEGDWGIGGASEASVGRMFVSHVGDDNMLLSLRSGPN